MHLPNLFIQSVPMADSCAWRGYCGFVLQPWQGWGGGLNNAAGGVELGQKCHWELLKLHGLDSIYTLPPCECAGPALGRNEAAACFQCEVVWHAGGGIGRSSSMGFDYGIVLHLINPMCVFLASKPVE